MCHVAKYVSNINHCNNVSIKYLYKRLKKTFVEEKQNAHFLMPNRQSDKSRMGLNLYFPTKNNLVPGHKSAHDYESRKQWVVGSR